MIPARERLLPRPLPPASLLAVLLLAACAGLAPVPTPTGAPLPPATETPTIIWFPPTISRTPPPSQSVPPTPELRPGLGQVLFADDFSDAALWNTVYAPSASVLVEAGQLTLTIAAGAPSTSLLSLRAAPTVADFYLEATVRLNLCRAGDRYGVVFRLSAPGSYYRYLLNCSGESRYERLVDGAASAPRDWLASADAPRGAPGEVKIGVWVVRNEMRFFLNDRYQFTILDGTYASGTLGLFAYTGGQTPVSVSFTGLTVHAVSYTSPAPGQTPTVVP